MSEAGSSPGSGALYHEVSPTTIRINRILGGITVLMVVLAFIFCLVQGSKNNTLYLLCCNLIICSFIGIVNAWWYKRGDLGADKFWYMMILSGVICFQCLATDIFVFNHDHGSPEPTVKPSVSSIHTTNPLQTTTAVNFTLTT